MHDSEEQLLCRAKKYEKEALSIIYDQNSTGLYVYAMRLLGDSHLAEECVSEAFSRFLSALKQGKGPRDYLKAYLYRIAHNWVTDYYRKKNPPVILIDEERFEIEDQKPLPAAQTELRMQQERIREALWQLTPEQRQVILLKYYEGWNNTEVAKVIEKPVGAVKALQHRGLAALRKLLLSTEDI